MTDKQNSTVQTLEYGEAKALEIKRALRLPSHDLPCLARYARKIFEEGAAEQRRKDAESVYQTLNEDGEWSVVSKDEYLQAPYEGRRIIPANVAALETEIEALKVSLIHSDGVRNEKQKRATALEARIAELEGAITALFDGQCVLENRGWDEKPDRIVLYDDEQMASGKDPVSVAVRGANNVRAALTREGGV